MRGPNDGRLMRAPSAQGEILEVPEQVGFERRAYAGMLPSRLAYPWFVQGDGEKHGWSVSPVIACRILALSRPYVNASRYNWRNNTAAPSGRPRGRAIAAGQRVASRSGAGR